MSFVDAVAAGFKNYFNFKGRASRSEFWYWVLFTVLLGIVLGTLESIIWPAPMMSADWMQNLDLTFSQPTPLSNASSLLLLIPNLSVTARRFHDAGFSAKWLLLQLIPLAYGIFAFIGAVVVIMNAEGREFNSQDLMAIIFLAIPIFALFMVIFVIYLVFSLKPSRSFYDGNKYVEPSPLSSGDEGTTA